MSEMMNLDGLKPEISRFLENLPTDHFHSNVANFSYEATADTDRLQGVAVLTDSYENEPLRLLHVFSDRKLLHSVLFSLFSGRTIAIIWGDRDSAWSFARRLSVVSPFESRFSVGDAGRGCPLRHC
jgi:hypothetical protein